VTVPTGGTAPDKEQRMASRQSAVVELYWRWFDDSGGGSRADAARQPLSMDDWDAIAHPADWTRPSLAA
jgi:hypothetical protein